MVNTKPPLKAKPCCFCNTVCSIPGEGDYIAHDVRTDIWFHEDCLDEAHIEHCRAVKVPLSPEDFLMSLRVLN